MDWNTFPLRFDSSGRGVTSSSKMNSIALDVRTVRRFLNENPNLIAYDPSRISWPLLIECCNLAAGNSAWEMARSARPSFLTHREEGLLDETPMNFCNQSKPVSQWYVHCLLHLSKLSSVWINSTFHSVSIYWASPRSQAWAQLRLAVLVGLTVQERRQRVSK